MGCGGHLQELKQKDYVLTFILSYTKVLVVEDDGKFNRNFILKL